MKLDPNSKEELPAVVRVAIETQRTYTGWTLEACLNYAKQLITAYNEGQDEEPSEPNNLAYELLSAVPVSIAYKTWVKEAIKVLRVAAREPSAKPMPTREEMVERAMEVLDRIDRAIRRYEALALIDYILDGGAK